jgi:hypothetical protein
MAVVDDDLDKFDEIQCPSDWIRKVDLVRGGKVVAHLDSDRLAFGQRPLDGKILLSVTDCLQVFYKKSLFSDGKAASEFVHLLLRKIDGLNRGVSQ